MITGRHQSIHWLAREWGQANGVKRMASAESLGCRNLPLRTGTFSAAHVRGQTHNIATEQVDTAYIVRLHNGRPSAGLEGPSLG